MTKTVASEQLSSRARLRVDRVVYVAALAVAACATLLASVFLAACLAVFMVAVAMAVASLFMDPQGHLHVRPQPLAPPARRVPPHRSHIDRLDPVEVGRIIDRPHVFSRYDRYDDRVAR